jgi:hypothetical protein
MINRIELQNRALNLFPEITTDEVAELSTERLKTLVNNKISELDKGIEKPTAEAINKKRNIFLTLKNNLIIDVSDEPVFNKTSYGRAGDIVSIYENQFKIIANTKNVVELKLIFNL